MDKLAVPIPNSYWVKPGQLLAGGYPRYHTEESIRADIQNFLAAGITTFIDLTQPGEYNIPPYADILQQEAETAGKTVTHQRKAIPDRGTPSVEQMHDILETINGAITAGETVYVHCLGGIGRTGTTVGCYLIEQGIPRSEVLDEILRLRQAVPGGWADSPETQAQREMIIKWGKKG